ncbi:54S ribosomal protein L28, mitochondrial [Grifola frondosa]|uniref:Large ribosomal subunit protein mL40 n=1 Tax=Grifola frondosa TaxID=5627 RepID=A0A1C7LUV2_GRIFR|nr:54S ribosomal protein L28, mitochondrial [Grifola frondosa]
MSSSLRVLRDAKLPLRSSQTSVRYYAMRKEAGGDPKTDIIRRALYPSNIRNRPSPTGTWRPDIGRRLQRAIPSVQAHETIERAWWLHQRHVRRERQADLDRKFQCMRTAMETLREVAPKLYAEANKEEDPRVRSRLEIDVAKTLKGPERKALESRIRGLFPRELRIPSDTPPRGGWNYGWSPVIDKSLLTPGRP